MKESSSIVSRVAGNLRCEEGSFITSVILLAVVIAVLAVGVLDGTSVFYAYRSAGDVTEGAANAAELEWRQSRSDFAARDAAANYCGAKGLSFDDFEVFQQPVHGYKVTCSIDASTHVFLHLPRLKDLIHQSSTSSAYDT